MHLRCKVQNDLVAIYRPSDGGDWVVTFCKRAAQVLLRRKLESGEVFDVDMTVTERPKMMTLIQAELLEEMKTLRQIITESGEKFEDNDVWQIILQSESDFIMVDLVTEIEKPILANTEKSISTEGVLDKLGFKVAVGDYYDGLTTLILEMYTNSHLNA